MDWSDDTFIDDDNGDCDDDYNPHDDNYDHYLMRMMTIIMTIMI